MTWKPGQSGNPAGRPKGFAGLAERVKSEVGVDGDKLVAFAMEVLGDTRCPECGGGPELRDRLAAMGWLADRGFGKPLQSVELQAAVAHGPATHGPRLDLWPAALVEEARPHLEALRAIRERAAAWVAGEQRQLVEASAARAALLPPSEAADE